MGLGNADGPGFEGALLRYNHFGGVGDADVPRALPNAAGGGGHKRHNEIEGIGDLYGNQTAGTIGSVGGVAAAVVSGGRARPGTGPYIAGVRVHQHTGRIDSTGRNTHDVTGNVSRLGRTWAGQFAGRPADAGPSGGLPSCIGNKVIGVERAAEIDNSKQEHQHHDNDKAEFQKRAASLAPGFVYVPQLPRFLPNMNLPGYPHLRRTACFGKRWQTRIRK